MNPVTVYGTRFCPYCVAAKQLLDAKGLVYQYIAVDNDHDLRENISRRSGQRTVPQIWIGDSHIGGCDDLYALHYAGSLLNALS